jgi:hypothetical protein
MSNAEIQKVTEFIKTLDADKRDDMNLDEAVHDTAATLASDANNGGLASQLGFLLKYGWNADTIIGYIKAEY